MLKNYLGRQRTNRTHLPVLCFPECCCSVSQNENIETSVAEEFSASQGLGVFLVASNVPLHKTCSCCMIFEK